MKVLIIGSGGREHALAWRLAGEGAEVLVTPGNAATPGAIDVQVTDIPGLADLAKRQRVDLSIIGPEVPLAAGLVDRFAERGLATFGPTRAAARLEWSKAWAKDFLQRHGIPTGGAEIVQSESAARRAIARVGLPVVLKADGLAAGKGVFVAQTREEADLALDRLFVSRALGDAADHVLVEELLEGPELSVLAFVDGERMAVMPPARDYKRLLDGDRGPNTGGMGGYTRPSYATPSLIADVEHRILQPAVAGMQAVGQPYRGVLYAGLMLTASGPKVLEFNCRFGDPECQLILPLLDTSLFEVCCSVVAGSLEPDDVHWADGRTYGVVLATRGYPDSPRVGDVIDGLDGVPDGVIAFHAGTRVAPGGRIVTAGGRVLTLVGGKRAAVYAAAESIRFPGKQYRGDVGVEVADVVGAMT